MDKMILKLVDFDSGFDEMIDLAISLHYELVSIHPFVDGNGRVGRLLFNLVLLQGGLPLSFIKIEERKQYLNSLEKAQLGGSKDDYYLIMLQSIERSLDIYLEKEQSTNTPNKLLKIGEFAKECNEDTSTIRYWTKLGLISTFGETQSGYALYSLETVNTAKRIRELQKTKRMTLEEINGLLNG